MLIYYGDITPLLPVGAIALLTVADFAAPAFINGVQDSFYPPILLPNWFDPTGGSQLVVIGRGIDPESLRQRFYEAVAL